jgi:hypothetical protein
MKSTKHCLKRGRREGVEGIEQRDKLVQSTLCTPMTVLLQEFDS